MNQFVMSKFATEKDLYKAKAEHFENEAMSFRVVLEDLAKYGLRSDLTPTRMWNMASDEEFKATLEEYQWWSEYMKSADSRVRTCAKDALNVSS